MMKNSFMNKILFALIILLFGMTSSDATIIQGGINTNETVKNYCTVIDKATRKPVPNAKVSVSSTGFTVYSDINGHFELKTIIQGQTILSVDKQNYKPFSMTLSRGAHTRPFIVEIESATPFDITIETKVCHLGDNNYSVYSANAGQFKGSAAGPEFNRKFFVSSSTNNKQQYLVIGSVIGIDTALARGMGQNGITTSFASPPAVFLNGTKIAEIQINGDNQKIRLPKNLIKYNQNNVITIKACRNLMQTAYIDYDDIEFANISIESQEIPQSRAVGYR